MKTKKTALFLFCALLQIVAHGADKVPSPGFALREFYFGISGNSIAELRSSPKFPNAPDRVDYISELEMLADFGAENGAYLDNYGVRVSGFLRPPVTGPYHFYLSSSDQGEFWLSTDASPASIVRLCHEPQWNQERYWTGTERRPGLENRSTTLYPNGVSLVAGNEYYFEALMKLGSFPPGYVGVTWQLPGDTNFPARGSPPIPGVYLAALADPSGVSLVVTQQPKNNLVILNAQAGDGAQALLTYDFEDGGGGFSVITPYDFSGAWRHDPIIGTWRADGQQEESGLPMTSRLRSIPVTVTRSGRLRLSFSHRYSFEFNGNRPDGGNLRASVNGGAYELMPASAFTANGYNGTVMFGNSEIRFEPAFTASSPGYGAGAGTFSVAELGFFFAGETVSVEFTYAADTSIRGAVPNWELHRWKLDEGYSGQAPAAFDVRATAIVSNYPNQSIIYQWESDCGSGFAAIPGENQKNFRFTPGYADNGCRFRSLMFVPGLAVTSAVVSLTVALPPLSLQRQETNVLISWPGSGTLQSANAATGTWVNVSGVTNGMFTTPIASSRQFYRLRFP